VVTTFSNLCISYLFYNRRLYMSLIVNPLQFASGLMLTEMLLRELFAGAIMSSKRHSPQYCKVPNVIYIQAEKQIIDACTPNDNSASKYLCSRITMAAVSEVYTYKENKREIYPLKQFSCLCSLMDTLRQP
jgi:hypothetical protein